MAEVNLNDNVRGMWDQLSINNRRTFVKWVCEEYGVDKACVKNKYIYSKECPLDRIEAIVVYMQNLLKLQNDNAERLFVNIPKENIVKTH